MNNALYQIMTLFKLTFEKLIDNRRNTYLGWRLNVIFKYRLYENEILRPKI